MKLFRTIILPATIAALAWAALSCSSDTGSRAIPPCEITTPLDSLFSTMFRPDEPGAIVGVVRNDSIVYLRGFGKASLAPSRPMTDSTMLNVCSITKTFVVAAVTKLAEAGKLSLDDSVAEYFPQFEGHCFKEVKLRHILSHTTGLPDLRPRNPDQWDTYVKRHNSTFGEGSDYLLYGREEELIRFYESVDSLLHNPGEGFHYQEPPFMLLSYVISQAAGMPFDQYMTDSIFSAAGLRNTAFFDPDTEFPNEAHGYAPVEGQPGKWAEYDYGEAEFFPTRADRGLYTTAADFIKWQKAFYGGKLISPENVARTIAWQTGTRLPNIGYGYGIFVENKPEMPYKAFHMSSNGGFSVFESVIPEARIFYFVLSNRPDWSRLATGHKIDAVLRSKDWI